MVKELDTTFAALADPTRRQVIELLNDGPKRAGELADATSMSNPAMSRHLKVLRSAGIIESHVSIDDARVREYRLCEEHLSTLSNWLDYRTRWTALQDSFSDEALEQQLIEFGRVFTEAVSAGDGQFFDENLTDDALLVFGPGRFTKAETVTSIGGGHVAYEDIALTDPHLVRLSADSAMLAVNFSATTDGKPVRRYDSSVFRRDGDRWKLAFMQSTDIS